MDKTLKTFSLVAPSTGDVTPEQLKILNCFADKVLRTNISNLDRSTAYIRRSALVLFGMYVVLFCIGVVGAVFALIKGFQATSPSSNVAALVLGGLSVTSFDGLFLTRPLESLERNSIYNSWFVAVMNTYWTQLKSFTDPKTISQDLKGATNDLIKELTALATMHAAAIGKYTPASSDTSQSTKDQQTVIGNTPPASANPAAVPVTKQQQHEQ